MASRIIHSLRTLALLGILLLQACTMRQLYTLEPAKTLVTFAVDWRAFPEDVSGMTATFHEEAPDTSVSRLETNCTDTFHVKILPGDYRLWLMNQSEHEFWTLEFSGLETDPFAKARNYGAAPSWYEGTQRVVLEPEALGIATYGFSIDDADVPREFVPFTKATTLDLGEPLVTLHPFNVVSSLQVRIYFTNIEYVRGVRGCIDGLAGGWHILPASPSDERVAEILADWTLVKDPDDATRGFVELVEPLSTFGRPEDSGDADAEDSVLYLWVLLADNATVLQYAFPVGDRYTSVPDSLGRVRMELSVTIGDGTHEDPIEIPDVIPADGGGGFLPNVIDWEEGETVVMPI